MDLEDAELLLESIYVSKLEEIIGFFRERVRL